MTESFIQQSIERLSQKMERIETKLDDNVATTSLMAATLREIKTELKYRPTVENCPLVPRVKELEDDVGTIRSSNERNRTVWLVVLGSLVLLNIALNVVTIIGKF